MQTSLVSALLLGFGMSAPEQTSSQPALSHQELRFLCSLPDDFRPYGHAPPSPAVGEAFRKATERRSEIALRELPPAVTCPGGRQRMLRYGDDFISALGFTADGSIAIIEGGWVKARLPGQAGYGLGGYGQSGDCFFARTEHGWSMLGCRMMLVIGAGESGFRGQRSAAG